MSRKGTSPNKLLQAVSYRDVMYVLYTMGNSQHLPQGSLGIIGKCNRVAQQGDSIRRWRWLASAMLDVGALDPVRLDVSQGISQEEREGEQTRGGDVVAQPCRAPSP